MRTTAARPQTLPVNAEERLLGCQQIEALDLRGTYLRPTAVAEMADCRYRAPHEAVKEPSRPFGSFGESIVGPSLDVAEGFEPLLYLSRLLAGVIAAAFGRLEVLLLIVVTNRM